MPGPPQERWDQAPPRTQPWRLRLKHTHPSRLPVAHEFPASSPVRCRSLLLFPQVSGRLPAKEPFPNSLTEPLRCPPASARSGLHLSARSVRTRLFPHRIEGRSGRCASRVPHDFARLRPSHRQSPVPAHEIARRIPIPVARWRASADGSGGLGTTTHLDPPRRYLRPARATSGSETPPRWKQSPAAESPRLSFCLFLF